MAKKSKKNKKSKKKEVAAIENEVAAAPVLTKKEKKKKKKSKKKRTEVAVAIPKKKKKKSKSKEIAQAPVIKKKKKKMKKKKKEIPAISKKRTLDSTVVKSPEKKLKSSGDYSYHEHPTLTGLSDAKISEIRKKTMVTVTNCELKPIQSFDQTGIPASDQKYLDRFSSPTPIQSESWAPLLSGRDCIGIAQTGSGKTLGFGLPAIPLLTSRNRKNKQRPIYMLTLSPTRELAQQTDRVLTELFAPVSVSTVCVYGGGDKREQLRKIRAGAQIVTATPGRLLACLREGSVKLDKVQYLVLDEADRMLDLGFEPDIRAIVSFITQPKRQTLLFSATWPKSIQKLASEFVNNPVHITVGNVGSLTASKNVTQIVEVLESRARMNRLLELLRKYHSSKKNRVLVFVLYKKEVGMLERFLSRKRWPCAGISSDKRQHEREQAITDFKTGSTPLLIATDVAARGLDIKNVEYVINFSFPLTVEDYIHRIGRTGRGGAKGLAHTFFTSENKSLSGELVNVLTDAGAEVPDALRAFGCFTKRKTHSMYGAFAGRSGGKPMPKRRKVTFD